MEDKGNGDSIETTLEDEGNGYDSTKITQWRIREMMNDGSETTQWRMREIGNGSTETTQWRMREMLNVIGPAGLCMAVKTTVALKFG